MLALFFCEFAFPIIYDWHLCLMGADWSLLGFRSRGSADSARDSEIRSRRFLWVTHFW
jgi:hypothetical protein